MNWNQAKDALIVGFITLLASISAWFGNQLWAAKDDNTTRLSILETKGEFDRDMLKETHDDVKELRRQVDEIASRLK